MNITQSIITLVILIAGVGMLIAAIGCERISRAIEALKRSSSARVTSAILGVVMIVGAAGPQLQVINRMINSEQSPPPIVAPTAAPHAVVVPTPHPASVPTAMPQPKKAKAKATPADPDLQQLPSLKDLRH